MPILTHPHKKTVPCSVVLPDAYGKEPGRRFPVVYMLHGAGGNHRSMPGDGVIAGLSDRHGFIAKGRGYGILVCSEKEFRKGRRCWERY